MDRQHPQTIEPGKPDPALPEFVQAPIAGATALSQTPDPDVPGRKFSARRFLSIVIGGIFLAEVAAMIILTRFSTLPYYLQTGIDAGIMVLLIFPIVYYFSLRPLLVQMEERRQTAAALRQSEERFAKAFHFSPTAFSISRKTDGGLIDVNESFVRLYGSKREDLVGHTSVELGMFPNPDERAELSRRTFEQQSAGGLGIREYEMETRAASGEARTVLISTEGIELDGEACILSSISDITERKHNEARLRWSYRALEVLSQCNEVLVRAEDETELLEEMCGIIVRVGGYRMAWVGFAEPDALKSVRPAAKAGFEEGYLDLVRISWGNNEHGNGPTGTSIRTGTIQVNQNFVTNPSMLPWRRAALERGYQSSISLPLRSNEDILGALTIYSESPEAFDTEEVTQLRRLAEDLGFGMQALRDRVRRTQAEARYREMALFPELNPDALLQVDASGCIRTCNPAAGALGIYMHSQLSDIMPDLPQVDLASCIANGTTGKISDVRLGERVLSWTIQGSPELGLAFLYSTDVTERKHAEDVIHRLSRIVEQTEDTVVVTNVEGAIEYVNPAFERITGYALEDVLGKTPRVLKSGLQGDPFYQRLWSTILGGEAFLAEIADRKKNGELFHEMKTITPLRNERGNITQFVATGKDITEHKRAEVELERRNRELQALSSAEHEQRQFSEALVAAALTLNKSLNLDEVLALILQEIEAVIPYQLADVALLEGKTFYDASHRGELSWPANLYGKRNGFPLEGFPVYHRMIVTGQPVLVYDTREEAEWVDISGLEGCRSFLSAPLLVDGKVIGFVSLFGRSRVSSQAA